jgi:hypothetical protein
MQTGIWPLGGHASITSPVGAAPADKRSSRFQRCGMILSLSKRPERENPATLHKCCRTEVAHRLWRRIDWTGTPPRTALRAERKELPAHCTLRNLRYPGNPENYQSPYGLRPPTSPSPSSIPGQLSKNGESLVRLDCRIPALWMSPRQQVGRSSV